LGIGTMQLEARHITKNKRRWKIVRTDDYSDTPTGLRGIRVVAGLR